MYSIETTKRATAHFKATWAQNVQPYLCPLPVTSKNSVLKRPNFKKIKLKQLITNVTFLLRYRTWQLK